MTCYRHGGGRSLSDQVVGGSADAQPAVVGGEAATGLEVEPPAVQRADQLVAVDLAEHAEVGLAVGAQRARTM